MKNHVSTLIVARPGRIRDGLRALLRATPGLELVGQADNSSSALGIVKNCRPALLLLDSNLPDEEMQSLLKQTKTQWPQTRCIVLASDAQQQWGAKAAGADRVLLNGFSIGKFLALVAELLPDEMIAGENNWANDD